MNATKPQDRGRGVFRVCVLGSGSRGNCTAVWSGSTRVLIDAGLNPGRIRREISELGLPAIDAILITHAHRDHIGPETYELASEGGIPVFCNRATWNAAKRKNRDFLELEEAKLVRFFDGDAFRIGDMDVRPFPVPHGRANGPAGADEPVGFAITHRRDGETYGLGYATDLGHVPDSVVERLADVDVLVIEANHCELLVDKLGQYHGPWVKSPYGHMNNLDTGRAIARILNGRIGGPKPLRVMLAHISQDHNTKARAMHQVRTALEERAVEVAGLYLTHQERRSRVIDIG